MIGPAAAAGPRTMLGDLLVDGPDRCHRVSSEPGVVILNRSKLVFMSQTTRPIPLRDPMDRRLPRIAGPCALVMFGVTGDLATKKLMPAIYDLANRGLLPPGFALVGFARRNWADEDFAQVVHNAVKEHSRPEFREEVWRHLAEGFRFVPGNFADDAAFDDLVETV